MSSSQSSEPSSDRASPSKKRAKEEETLPEVLQRLSPDSKDGSKYLTTINGKAVINNFLAEVYEFRNGGTDAVKLTEKRCYFLTSRCVKFRHQGDPAKMPSKVFVEDLSEEEKTPVVFHSASGTGKTVELASSVATRGTDFTLVLQFSDDIDHRYKNIDPTDGTLKSERNKAALALIQDEIKKILDGNETAVGDILLAKKGEEFLLTVAIDEASTCRLLTRAVISDHADFFNEEIANFILEKTAVPPGVSVPPIRVIFSIGGTGAYMKYIGSQANDFSIVEPTATSEFGLYWKTALREAGVLKFCAGNTNGQQGYLTPDQVKEHLPVLGCLMQNARMASIALHILLSDNRPVAIDEAQVVNKVIKKFISSNGLKRLEWPKKKEAAAAIAACAFAVHLFQWDRENPSEFVNEKMLQEWLYEMKSGVDFAWDVGLATNLNNTNMVTAIVSNYGLLEQRHDPFRLDKGMYLINKPFLMRPSQQLVALHLLGADVSNMVASNPHGFEVLTTQIIKAALAASSVVAETSRPSIAKSLKTIGFNHTEGITYDSMGNLFRNFDTLKVVRHYFGEASPGNSSSFQTHLMKVELETLHVNGYQGGVKIDGVEVFGDHEVVMIDGEVAGRLKKLVHQRHGKECHYYPPITCVNYGNSPLADGFVTCLARDTSDNKSGAFPVSILNQSKDKHSNGGMPITKLNTHADRCAKEVLDGLFGSQRLLCVSTPTQQFSDSYRCKKCNFLPYVLSQSNILEGLMSELLDQRSKQGQIKEHAQFFNGNGKKVELV